MSPGSAQTQHSDYRHENLLRHCTLIAEETTCLAATLTDQEAVEVIVLKVSRLSQSMRDLATTIEKLIGESDTALHILDMNLAIKSSADDPYQRAFVNIM